MTSQTPEETHNTREVEEKKYPSHKELDMEKYYRIVKSGSFDNMFNYGFEVGKAFHQQELQKARQDWLQEEIVKLEGMKQPTIIQPEYGNDNPNYSRIADTMVMKAHIHNQALQTIIDRYQAELNQDNK